MTTSRQHDIKQIQQLGLRVEIAFIKAMAVEQLASNEVIAAYDGLAEPVFSVVMDTQTTEKELDDVIKTVVDFYNKRTSGWSWIIGPLSLPEPSILAKHLKRHDLFMAETYPGMYFNLEQDIPPPPTIALDIREVDSTDSLGTWIKPVSAAFTPSKDNGEGFRKLNARLPHGAGTAFRHYIGYHNNEPVSACTLFIHNELAMIHNVATQPLFQRQKFGTAMVTQALRDAKIAGVKHCFLDTSEKGKNVYSRLGFEEYCMQSVYKLK